MKVQELLEKIESKGFDIKKELEIKKYIPVMEKKKFATNVIAACTYDVDDYITVDSFKMDIYFHMNLLKLYTNLEIANSFHEIVEQYDILCEKGILNVVIGIIGDDYDALDAILGYELDALLEENSLECQVVKVANKINGIMNVASEKIKNVDFNKLLPEGVDISSILQMLKLLK